MFAIVILASTFFGLLWAQMYGDYAEYDEIAHKPATFKDYPFMAIVVSTYDQEYAEFGGAIATLNLVLVPKHAIGPEDGFSMYLVCVGDDDCLDMIEAYDVIKNDRADVAFLKLGDALERKSYLQPADFIKKSDCIDWMKGTSCEVLMFAPAGGEDAQEMRAYEVVIDICEDYLWCAKNNKSTYSHMCLGNRGGPLICNGNVVGMTMMLSEDKCDSINWNMYFSQLYYELHWLGMHSHPAN